MILNRHDDYWIAEDGSRICAGLFESVFQIPPKSDQVRIRIYPKRGPGRRYVRVSKIQLLQYTKYWIRISTIRVVVSSAVWKYVKNHPGYYKVYNVHTNSKQK